MNPDVASIPLRDIHMPESVSWWPLAPGWWITLGLFVFAAIAVYILKRFKEYRDLEKQSISEFTRLVEQYQMDRNTNELLANVSQLLRRVCITRFINDDVAALTGDAWLDFLDQAFKNRKTSNCSTDSSYRFSGELGQLLVMGQYQRTQSVDEKKLDQLLVLTKAWLVNVGRQRNLQQGQQEQIDRSSIAGSEA